MADNNVKFTWTGNAAVAIVKNASVDGLEAAGLVLQRSMKDIMVNGGGVPSRPGQPPHAQSGGLRRSIGIVTNRAAGVVRVGTANPLGRWMEFGVSAIRAKRARYLAIPLNKKAERMYAGQKFLQGATTRQSLRSRKNLTVIKSKAGNLILLETDGKGGIKPNGAAFILKDQVSIKPRPWVWPAYNRAKAQMQAAFTAKAKESMARQIKAVR